jgi:hypothetical protein
VVRRAAVVTHRRPADTTEAVRTLMQVARGRRVTLCFTPDEADKHGIEVGPFVEIVPELGTDIDLCVVLGGDGTILTALRRYAGTGVPVFAVNYGEVGFWPRSIPTASKVTSTAPSRASSTRSSCPRSPSGARTAPGARSTTSACIGSRACAWPTSPTRSRVRRSGVCAATGS